MPEMNFLGQVFIIVAEVFKASGGVNVRFFFPGLTEIPV